MPIPMPRISAVVTIEETGQRSEVEFTNVNEMIDLLVFNMILAERVYNRTLLPPALEEAGDVMTMRYMWADDKSLYTTVVATRHITH